MFFNMLLFHVFVDNLPHKQKSLKRNISMQICFHASQKKKKKIAFHCYPFWTLGLKLSYSFICLERLRFNRVRLEKPVYCPAEPKGQHLCVIRVISGPLMKSQ